MYNSVSDILKSKLWEFSKLQDDGSLLKLKDLDTRDSRKIPVFLKRCQQMSKNVNPHS